MIKLNGKVITPTIFPDKTSQVWKLPEELLESQEYNIELSFESESEIFHLMQLNKLLKHGRVPRRVTLHLPYLPYGRQDKEVDNNATFALRVFSDVINSMRFDLVTTIDAHSKVASEVIDRLEDLKPDKYIEKAAESLSSTSLILGFPDKGASDRYSRLGNGVIGNKVRNQLTGHIESYSIVGDVTGKDVLIVDDICDGGMTFKLFAKDLLTNGAKSVNLYVTHGIFSKGIETLKESGISRIFTKEGEVK